MNKKIKDASMYILLIFVILGAYSIHYIFHARILWILFLGFLVLNIAFLNWKWRINNKDFITICLFEASAAMLIVCGHDFMDKNFLLLDVAFVFLLLFFSQVINNGKFNQVLNIFVNIIFVLALISLFFYIFGTILGWIPYIKYYDSATVGWSSYWGYKSYYGVYYDGQTAWFLGHNILRNASLFAESPIFASILTIALYITMVVFKEMSYRTYVIILAMITTFSTTSLAIGSLIIFYHIYEKHLKNKKLIILMPIIFVIAVWVAFLIIADKLMTNNISGSIRIDDIIACFLSWKSSPFIGNGYSNIKALEPFRSVIRNNAGNSCGIGAILSDGGIILGIWYVLPMIMAAFNILKKKNIEYNFLVMLIFVIFFIMIIHYTILGIFLVAMSWSIVLHQDKIEKNMVNIS